MEKRNKNEINKGKLKKNQAITTYHFRVCVLVFQIYVKDHGHFTKCASRSILIFLLGDYSSKAFVVTGFLSSNCLKTRTIVTEKENQSLT